MQTNMFGEEINQEHLNDIVQKALDRPSVQIVDWKASPLQGGLEFDSAVFRCQGQAKDGEGGILPWSLILKAVKPPKKAQMPDGFRYWKREVLAYQCGLLQNLPGLSVTAPVIYEIQDRTDNSIWLWMEDIKDDVQNPWTVEQYAVAARHLGQFNGAYLVREAIPNETCVTHNWLRKYVENAANMIEFVRGNPTHPIVRHLLPDLVLAEVLALWDEHERILEVIENLPQVFCHQDAFRRNLFARGGKTVAIDWGYSGIAPVGAELVALIAGSLGFWEVPAEKVMEMDRLCFESYVQGLRDAGWMGDPKLVRTGYTATLLLRYPIGGQIGEIIPTMLNQANRSRLEAAFDNKSAEDIWKSDPAIIAYYESRIPEAIKLIGVTNMLRVLGRIGVNTVRVKAARK